MSGVDMKALAATMRGAADGLCTENPHAYMPRGVTAGHCLEAADALEAQSKRIATLEAELAAAREAADKNKQLFLTQASEAAKAASYYAEQMAELRAQLAEKPRPCDLCAGQCRSHPLGDSRAWEPEEGSLAWWQREAYFNGVEASAQVAENCQLLERGTDGRQIIATAIRALAGGPTA